MGWGSAWRRPVRAVLVVGSGGGIGMLLVVWFAALGAAVGQLAGAGSSSKARQADQADAVVKVNSHAGVLAESGSGVEHRSVRQFRRPRQSSFNSVFRERLEHGGRKPVAAGDGTYRTLCVRLCDGYFFPISTATTRSRFRRDEMACQSKCSSPAKLFVYPTRDGSPQTMVDLAGRAYGALPTAFAYRAKYDPGCQCRPHPWQPDAINAHQRYVSTAWQQRAKRPARRRQATSARRRSWIAARRRHTALNSAFAGTLVRPNPRNDAADVTAANRSRWKLQNRAKAMGLGASGVPAGRCGDAPGTRRNQSPLCGDQ